MTNLAIFLRHLCICTMVTCLIVARNSIPVNNLFLSYVPPKCGPEWKMTSRQNAKWLSPVINFSFFNAPCLVKGKTDGTEWNICVDVTIALIGPSRFVRIHCVFFWIIKREHRIIPSSENREVAWQKKGPFFGHKMSRISKTTERILIIQKAIFTKSWDLSDWVISVIIWETWNFGLLMLIISTIFNLYIYIHK